MSIESNHAEKIKRVGTRLFRVSGWKGKRRISEKCKEFVKITSKKPQKPKTVTLPNGKTMTFVPTVKPCGKPVTHEVVWYTPRFYGEKRCVDVFCQEHAEKWAKYLKHGKTDRNVEINPIA